MKFTQISTLALAAMMAFSSCSKEEVMNPGEADLLPGEARIVFDLGRKGATTYSNIANETAILDASAKLFTSEGDSIPAKFIFDKATKKLSATIDAKHASATNVTFYAYLNYKDKNGNGVIEGAGDKAMQKHDAAVVKTLINRELTNGAPAGIRVQNLTLTPGMTTVIDPKETAKRAIARVAAKAGVGATSIEGFTISLDKVNLTSGALYAGTGNQGSTVEGTQTLSYTLKSDGKAGDATVLTDGFETVGYMYPSSMVTAKITPKGGTDANSKTVTFTPQANKNYTISITPKTTSDGTIDFTVTIAEAWESGGDLDVDFNSMINEKSLPAESGLTLVGSDIVATANGVGTGTLFVDLVDFLGADVKIGEIAIASDPKTYSNISDSFDALMSADKRVKYAVDEGIVKVSFMPNNTGAKKEYTFKLTYKKGESTKDATIDVKFSQPAIEYHPNFSVQIGAHEWMTINTQNTGNLADDIAVLKEIENTPGADFNARMIAYAATNLPKLAGGFSRFAPGTAGDALTAKQPTCPIGYAVPSAQIFRNEFLGIEGTWDKGTSEKIFEDTELALGTAFTGTTGKTKTINNTLTFNKLNDDRNGYLTIRDSNGNVAIAVWLGQMDPAGVMQNPFISGYITSTPYPAKNSTQRTIIGMSKESGDYADIVDTAISNTNAGSSLVRCVKQTPDMYWAN